MRGRRQLSLMIGGLQLQLTLIGLSPAASARLLADYTLFLQPWHQPWPQACTSSSGPNVALAVDIVAASGPPFLEPRSAPTWRIETQRAGSRILYRSYFERGWIDLAARRAALLLRPGAHPENFLRVACAWLAIEHRGLLLHASGIVRDGRGYVFFGHSGAGKSTVAELSPGAAILSDDLVWLRLQGGRIWLHGVPFRGELQAPHANAAAPVAGLYALEQAAQHRLRSLPPLLGAARLLACAPFVTEGVESAAHAMDICAALAQAQPIAVLEFARDGGFWPLITAASPGRCRRTPILTQNNAQP
jgi:hypothetical protein